MTTTHQIPTEHDYNQAVDAILAADHPITELLHQLEPFEIETDWHGETPTAANIGDLYSFIQDADASLHVLAIHVDRLRCALSNMHYLRQQREIDHGAEMNGTHGHASETDAAA